MIQSNSKTSQCVNLQQIEIHLNRLEFFQIRLQNILNILKTPITFIHPPGFQDKIIEAKQHQQINNQWVEKYKEVVADIIQGQINKSLAIFAIQFTSTFGGQFIFWMDLICNFAQNQQYDQTLRIWHIVDSYKNCLHLSVSQYQKNKKLRNLMKYDIQISKKVINSINQLKKVSQNQNSSKKSVQQILQKLTQNYQAHENSNQKIVEFLKNDEDQRKNLNFFKINAPIKKNTKSKISQASSSRTKRRPKDKQIFDQDNNLRQKTITQFSFQIGQHKNKALRKRIQPEVQIKYNQQKYQKNNELDKLLLNFGNNRLEDLQKLRFQITNSKSKLFKNPSTIISNIQIDYSALLYLNYPVTIQGTHFQSFGNCFQQIQKINYSNNDYEEYQEIQAQLIASDQSDPDQDSDDNSLTPNQKKEFVDQDNPWEFDQEDNQVFKKAFRIKKQFCGCSWIFNSRSDDPLQINIKNPVIEKKNQNEKQNKDNKQQKVVITPEMVDNFFEEIAVVYMEPLPMPIQQPESSQIDFTADQIKKLKEVFHEKTYKDAMNSFEQSQELSNEFSYSKLRNFIRKLTKKVNKKIDGKNVSVYHVFDNEEQAKKGKATKAKTNPPQIKQTKQRQKQILDPQTSANQPELNQNKKINQNPILLVPSNSSNSKSKRLSNQTFKRAKLKNNSKSQSQYFPNKSNSVTVSNQLFRTNKNKQQQNSNNCDIFSIDSLSRLRPRKSKPNYNLDQIFKIGKLIELTNRI